MDFLKFLDRLKSKEIRLETRSSSKSKSNRWSKFAIFWSYLPFLTGSVTFLPLYASKTLRNSLFLDGTVFCWLTSSLETCATLMYKTFWCCNINIIYSSQKNDITIRFRLLHLNSRKKYIISYQLGIRSKMQPNKSHDWHKMKLQLMQPRLHLEKIENLKYVQALQSYPHQKNH